MKNKIKVFLKLITVTAFVISSLVFSVMTARAAEPTDEILKYYITVEPQDDATLNITYDISWKVLESDSLGPLEWVEIGLPNKHSETPVNLSDTISRINIDNYYAKVYFKDKYYKDEVVDFSYTVNMDYMYSMNEKVDGYTEYSFTPGWFNDITVDDLTIRWNIDKVDTWSSGGLIEGDYLVYSTSLNPGEKYTVTVSYPNDAYAFNETKSYVDANGSSDSNEEHGAVYDFIVGIFSLIFIGLFLSPVFIIVKLVNYFVGNRGLSSSTTKKITRTKIEYYPNCPGCGAGREEGKETCPYCGKNMVKSREVVEEDKIADSDKALLTYKTNGEYRYSSNPNSYIRVNVVNVPRPVSSSSHHSSCAHSSCAHSSCACACACACAGGGRAGCTTKDFYNTNLKLRNLKGRKK